MSSQSEGKKKDIVKKKNSVLDKSKSQFNKSEFYVNHQNNFFFSFMSDQGWPNKAQRQNSLYN